MSSCLLHFISEFLLQTLLVKNSNYQFLLHTSSFVSNIMRLSCFCLYQVSIKSFKFSCKAPISLYFTHPNPQLEHPCLPSKKEKPNKHTNLRWAQTTGLVVRCGWTDDLQFGTPPPPRGAHSVAVPFPTSSRCCPQSAGGGGRANPWISHSAKEQTTPNRWTSDSRQSVIHVYYQVFRRH